MLSERHRKEVEFLDRVGKGMTVTAVGLGLSAAIWVMYDSVKDIYNRAASCECRQAERHMTPTSKNDDAERPASDGVRRRESETRHKPKKDDGGFLGGPAQQYNFSTNSGLF